MVQVLDLLFFAPTKHQHLKIVQVAPPCGNKIIMPVPTAGGAARAAPLPRPSRKGRSRASPATWGRAFSFGPTAGSTTDSPLPFKDFAALKAVHQRIARDLRRTVKCEVDVRYDPAVGFVKAPKDEVSGCHPGLPYDEGSVTDAIVGADAQSAVGRGGASGAVLPAYSLDGEEETKAAPSFETAAGHEYDDASDEDVSDDELRVRALVVPVDVPAGACFYPDHGCRLSIRMGSVLAGHERGLNACLKEDCACEGVFYKEFNCLKSHLYAVISLSVTRGASPAAVRAAWADLRATQPELAISYNDAFTDVTVSAARWVDTPTATDEYAGQWRITFRPTVDTDRLNAMCWPRATVGANVVDGGVFEIRTKPSCWLVFEGVPLSWDADQFEEAVRSIDVKGALVSTTLARSEDSASGPLGFAKFSDRVRAGEACFAFMESPHAAEQVEDGAGIKVSLVRSLNRQIKRRRDGRVEVTSVRHPATCRRGIVYAQVQVRRTPAAMERRRAARRLVLPRAVKRSADADSDCDDDDDCARVKRARCVWDMVEPAMSGPPLPTLPVAVVPRARQRPLHLASTAEVAVWEEFPELGAPFGWDYAEARGAAAAAAGAGGTGEPDDEDITGGADQDIAAALRASAAGCRVPGTPVGGSPREVLLVAPADIETESEAPSPTTSDSSFTGASLSSRDADFPPLDLGSIIRTGSMTSFASAGGVPSSFAAVLKAQSVELRRAGSVSAKFAKDLDELLDDPCVALERA